MRKLCKIQLNKDKLVSARKIKKIQNKNIAKKKEKKRKNENDRHDCNA